MTDSRYTPELAAEICKRVSEGSPLRQVCRDADIGVAESSVREWARSNRNGFASQHAQARAMRLDAWSDEILTVAYRQDLDRADDADFVSAARCRPVEVATAIKVKLHGGRGSRSGALSVLAMGPDGSLVVSADYVQRLGGGSVDRGRQVLDHIVADIRARRPLIRSVSAFNHLPVTPRLPIHSAN